MGKTALKALAAIGAGGVTAAVVWLLGVAGVVLEGPTGLAVLGLIGSASTWLVAKAVAASGPAPASPTSTDTTTY